MDVPVTPISMTVQTCEYLVMDGSGQVVSGRSLWPPTPFFPIEGLEGCRHLSRCVDASLQSPGVSVRTISWMTTCPPVIVMSADVSVAQVSKPRPPASVAVPTYLPSKALGAAGPCADEVAAGTASALRITKVLGKPRNLIAASPGWRARAALEITARNFKILTGQRFNIL